MAKKEVSKEILELKKDLTEGKVRLGTKKVLEELKEKKISRVYLANNCPEEALKEVEYYSKFANVPIVRLKVDNEEFGVLCKKRFFVSVLGVKK